jgi:uroporphyrinogen-III synthase
LIPPPAAGPLDDQRVVVTRARDQAGTLATLLEEEGARVLIVPTVAIADPPSWVGLDAALARLAADAYDWTLFASVNAVGKVCERLDTLGIGLDALKRTRLGAVGPATADALGQRGLHVDLRPEEYRGEALVPALGKNSGRALLPRALEAPRGIVVALQRGGWDVDEVAAYQTLPPREETADTGAARAGDFDVLTFTSGSSARNFASHVAAPARLGLGSDDPSNKLVVCIGPPTAEAARAAGFRVDAVASEHTAAGLVTTLCEIITARRHSA